MSFYLVSLNFVRPAVVLIDDQPRTKQFDGKTVIFLVVGEKQFKGELHICGFISNENALPSAAVTIIRNNYQQLLQMDIDSRINWIKELVRTPDLKIKKDLIVDRTVGDGPGPIHMFNRSRSLWS